MQYKSRPKTVYNGKRTSLNLTPPWRPDQPDYPSVDVMSGSPDSTAKKETNQYTGTVVIGIATMHKSNPIPVTSGIMTNPKIQ